MGDQIQIPRFVITFSLFFFVFLPSLSKAIFKTAELPALCDVISSVSQLFVPYFAMSAFVCIYLPYCINKQRNMSFEFSSILLTVDRLKH